MENPHKAFDEIGDELDKRGLYWVDAETQEEINEFISEVRISDLAAKQIEKSKRISVLHELQAETEKLNLY